MFVTLASKNYYFNHDIILKYCIITGNKGHYYSQINEMFYLVLMSSLKYFGI